MGGIDTDSLGFLPDIDLLEVKRPHFYNHFGYVDLLGGMEKELSDRFADVDLLGGSSTCPVHNRLLIGKTWHFGRVPSEKPRFTVGFPIKVLTFWVGSVDLLGVSSSVTNCISKR